MQKQSERETNVAQSVINTERLSQQLNKVAALLTPKEFRRQFSLRYQTLLAVTGVDWKLCGDMPVEASDLLPGQSLTVKLSFPMTDKYLLFTRSLKGLPDTVVGKVVENLSQLASDWASSAKAAASTSASTPATTTSAGIALENGSQSIRLKSASSHLPDFTPSRLAHKLRNYLTPIISGAGQIQETAQIEGHEDQATMAQLVVTGARHQEELLSRFMLSYGPLEIQRAQINLVDLLHSILSAYRSRGHRSFELGELPDEILCYQDDHIMRCIYTELIDNAIEAAGDDPIAISVANDEESTSLQVVNPGTSTIDEIEAQFFTPFFSRKNGHNGLGLPIARRLARELGGDVRATTTNDAICFEITIPRNLYKS